jgi:uncharacterized protein (TIGR00255 family)
MTGTGAAAGATEVGELRAELRSVNGRGFTLKQRLCTEVTGFEAQFEEQVRQRVARGTVTLIVDRHGAQLPDRSKLRQLTAELRALARDLGLPDDLSLRDVLAAASALPRSSGPTRELPPGLQALLARALDELQRHRFEEGAATTAALRRHLDELTTLHASASRRAPAILVQLRERLLQRVGEVLAAQGVSLQPADVVREVALLADRIDVAEELQRLRAHLEAVRATLAAGGQIGRRLEFLAQEVWREANTLGAKSPDVEMTHIVVAMKSCIDRIKEQVANLE